VFSFLRTLTTWHCPHSPASAVERRTCSNRYHLLTAASCSSSGPTRTDTRTDKRTDIWPFHRPCSAHYASSANNWLNRLKSFFIYLVIHPTMMMMMIVDDHAAHQILAVSIKKPISMARTFCISMPWTSSPTLPLAHLPVDYSIYSLLSRRRIDASDPYSIVFNQLQWMSSCPSVSSEFKECWRWQGGQTAYNVIHLNEICLSAGLYISASEEIWTDSIRACLEWRTCLWRRWRRRTSRNGRRLWCRRRIRLLLSDLDYTRHATRTELLWVSYTVGY